MRDIVLGAELFKPVGSAASCRYNGVICKYLYTLGALFDIHALAHVALENDVVALIAEEHIDAVFNQVLLYRIIYILRFFGTEVADRAVNKAKSRLYGALSDLLDLLLASHTLNMSVRAELKVNFICIFYRLLRDVDAYELRELAADLGAERELPVREGARAREAGRDVAIGLAVDALVGLRLGAAALFDRLTLFDHHDFFL